MTSKKVKFSVYTDARLKEKLDKLAEEEERSLAYITSKAIEFYLDNYKKKIVEDEVHEAKGNNEDSIFINTNFNSEQVDEF